MGTDSISLTPVLGLVAETRELLFNDSGPTSGGVYYVGKFAVDGSSVNANDAPLRLTKASAVLRLRMTLRRLSYAGSCAYGCL